MGSDKYNDTNMKLCKLQNLCGIVQRTHLGKAQKEIILTFYNVMAIPVLHYGSD
jgi:hypothetical protein